MVNNSVDTYTQKAGLQCCCSADRGSGIALVTEQATLSPRCMYVVRAMRVPKYTP